MERIGFVAVEIEGIIEIDRNRSLTVPVGTMSIANANQSSESKLACQPGYTTA